MNTQYPKIYVDEAGNTGSNILNPDQKYFILSAVNFTDEELDKIREDINYPKELHFVKMKRSSEGRMAIKKLLQHPLIDADHITYEFVDKNFCTYAQITDMVIEPVFYYIFHENLYKKRGNIQIANCFYVFAENHPYPDYIVDFKSSFEKMIREQTQENIEEFYENVYILSNQTKNESFKEILSWIEMSKNVLEHVLVEDNKYGLDTTMASLLVLVDHWAKKTNQKLDIITDNSKQIQAKEQLIRNLMNIKTSKNVGYDTRKSFYPIQIHTLNMVDSANNFGVQLADLIASSVAFRYNDADKFVKFQDEIKDFPFFDIPCYPIIPVSAKEMTEPVDDSDDSDPMDFLVENLPSLS